MNLVGNNAVKNRLDRLIEKAQVPHLLLFTGPDGVGKKLFAIEFARSWLAKLSSKEIKADHPDISVVVPEGKTGMHSIASIRRLIDEIALSPYAAAGKVLIIDDAERMLPTSANTLLKTLEEPPKNRFIILVSSQPARLLETIVSRSQEVRFQPLECDLIQKYLVEHELSTDVAIRARGSIGTALRLLQKNVDDVQALLFDFLVIGGWKSFHAVSHTAEALQKLLEAKKKGKEQALRKEVADSMKEFSASQKQLVEQEIEGAVSLLWMQDTTGLLETIGAYFRDLFALQCGPNHPPLYFAHKKEALLDAYNRGEGLVFDGLDARLREAKLALERSTPLQHVLETLFIQL